MYIHVTNNDYERARIFPHAALGSDPRFLAAQRHFTILKDGTILYNGQEVTVESVSREAAEMILAVMEAAKIAAGGFET